MFVNEWSIAATGLGIGLAIAAPVGPVNLIILNRVMRRGFWSGIAAGCGAVLADTIFAAGAAFGITAIATFIEGHITIFRLVGSVLLLVFGIRVYLTRPEDLQTRGVDTRLNLLGAAVSCFALTISNPATMFGLAAIFGGLGPIGEGPEDWDATAALVAGVAAGSLVWWLLLATAVTWMRGRITKAWLRVINVVSGGLLALVGAAVLVATAIGF
jgi:threonine/homoserine/homoserine lactone efflux protein